LHISSSSGRSRGPRRPRDQRSSTRARGQDHKTHVQCRICHKWYRAVTYTHLKYLHGIESPSKYKEEYSLSKITSEEVRGRIAEKKFLVDRHAVDYIRRSWGQRSLKEITSYLGINPSTVRAHARRMGLGLLVERWDLRKVLRGLRRAHRDKIPLNSGHARKHLSHLYKAAIKYCRSWKNALREAGIRYESVSLRGPFEAWSQERVAAEIRELHRQGRDLDYAFIQTHHPRLYGAARNHFGSWKAARRAAGLPESKDAD
jgi:hypothetical protein